MAYASYQLTCKNFDRDKCFGCSYQGRDPEPKCYENAGKEFIKKLWRNFGETKGSGD